MSVIHNDLLLDTDEGGYNLTKSLRFRSSASAYLNKSYSGGVGNTTTFTWSAWVKRGSIGSVTQHLFNGGSGVNTFIGFGQVNYDDLSGNLRGTGGTNYFFGTSAVFRDPAAWYHIVLAVDTTQATSSNRLKLYVNGVLQSLSTANYPPQNQVLLDTGTRFIGQSGSTYYLDGYLADTYFIDGTQKAATDFGETDAITGVWKPKAYSGTYGTNGFYLPFTDVATTSGSNAGLGKDFSGNGNYWTTNNISVTSGSTYDSMKDVPTLTDTDTANYATLNPVDTNGSPTISNGNLLISSSSAAWRTSRSTIALPLSVGKFYMEVSIVSGTNNCEVGFCSQALALNEPFALSTCVAYSAGGGQKYVNGSATSYGSTWAVGDIMGVAYDTDAGTITFYKNNTSQGAITTGWTAGLYSFVLSVYDSASGTTSAFANFGQRPFAYTPPTGFKALNTYNLPDSTIVAGNEYMDATTYTGNSSTNTITNAGGFKPDLVWIKARNQAFDHVLTDSVRGTTKYLISNKTDAEGTYSSGVTSFNTNGFTLGSDTGAFNSSAGTFVGWQWQAGQGTTSSNTSGSITSTVSVNASAGFSIVTYTGNGANATIGHGLGVAPSLFITKTRNVVQQWNLYHSSLGNTGALQLNGTGAFDVYSGYWNNTSPTSSVFTVGSPNNANGQTYVAYCWSEIAGFSKFGSYTGTGSDDGPFVYLGFRPKWVMFKRTDTGATNWNMIDSSRDQYNPEKQYMSANTTNAEGSDVIFDFVSNGFKVRENWTDTNASGGTYIYAAFAETPQKLALAR